MIRAKFFGSEEPKRTTSPPRPLFEHPPPYTHSHGLFHSVYEMMTMVDGPTGRRNRPGRPGSLQRRRWEKRNVLSPRCEFEVAIEVAEPIPSELLYELLPDNRLGSESPFVAMMQDLDLLDALLDGTPIGPDGEMEMVDWEEYEQEYDGETSLACARYETPGEIAYDNDDEAPSFDSVLALDPLGCAGEGPSSSSCPPDLDGVHAENEIAAGERAYLRIPRNLRDVFRSSSLSLVTVQAMETLLLDELAASEDGTFETVIDSSFHRCIFHGLAAYHGLHSCSYTDPDSGVRYTSAFTKSSSSWSSAPCSLVHVLLSRPTTRS